MKGIIVAAGLGSRLVELTKNTPKSLIEINGKSILERQIFAFKKLEITDITVIIGPHAEKYSFEGISFIHDDSYLEHDILSSFMLARKIIDDDTIVSYGDVIFDENILQPLINFKGLIGLGIDFDWEKNYEGLSKELKLEATVTQVRYQICTKIVDGRELKSKDHAILEITDSKNEKLGEFVGLMKLSKQGGKIFTEKYEKLIKTSTGPFHEANSLDDALFPTLI